MAIELRHLRYFQAVAHELSFSRAARLANVSQSSISEQIQRLEDVVGVPLVDRRSRNIRLTPPGELLFEQIGPLLGSIDDVVRRVRALGGQTRQVLIVGYSEMAIGTLMPAILHALREQYPEIEVVLREQSSVGVEQALLAGIIDIAFVPAARCASRISLVELGMQDVLLAVAEAAPLARHALPTLADLGGQNVILPDEASTLSRHVMAAFARFGLTPTITARANRASSLLTFVASEQGITFLPASLAGLVPTGVTTRKLPDLQRTLPFAMLWLTDSLNPAISRITTIARRELGGIG